VGTKVYLLDILGDGVVEKTEGATDLIRFAVMVILFFD